MLAAISLPYIQTPIFALNTYHTWMTEGTNKLLITTECRKSGFDRSLCSPADNQFINQYREAMIEDFAPLMSSSTPHGLFASACRDHCQAGTGWGVVIDGGIEMREAARRWYFESATEKIMESARLPDNPTCTHTEQF